jgi:hypothetical protein
LRLHKCSHTVHLQQLPLPTANIGRTGGGTIWLGPVSIAAEFKLPAGVPVEAR